MRHSSLHINVFYKYGKYYVWEINIKGDILVKKIKVKKIIFQFLRWWLFRKYKHMDAAKII